MRARRAILVVVVVVLAAPSLRLDAHKPITSPYTFAEDVAPILRERCASCHVAGGPAPMALTTAEETVPWGESIRLELVAGHMPPWAAMSNGVRLRHAEGLSARELNVLLTWVTGGTPPGDRPTPSLTPARETWPLGEPDATIALPETTVAADRNDVTREIVLPLDPAMRRPLRAVDLRPGTRSLVRSARVMLRSRSTATSGNTERVLTLWVPGDTPVTLPPSAAFDVPADAEIVVTLRLKKTWEHEREAMSDRSLLALYFAAAGTAPVAASEMGGVRRPPTPPPGAASAPAGGVAGGERLTAATRLLAAYPTPAAAGGTVTLDAIDSGGVRHRILQFAAQRGWERRYWFDEPIDLPATARLEWSVKFDQFPELPSGPMLILDTVPVSRP